ncbi:hydroxyphenylacetyl-CoA thioesterase PaaI [Actinomadura spongiicola]|uniref:Hydroxyphenylacetyl-CoA thioesterase PaaI n=1 Tax=Actinomadura spongiicola TaxID=2303421 RepID=A0A372GPM3_9ACTN|nr:hydroxyphenylacetyl-CoA thioesterase PaaI [Actinomadura spongiicola]RFS87348.1 hydroxyphenylacetyl-CoA thioesterase PaaI [Actinomadura spongiicola]
MVTPEEIARRSAERMWADDAASRSLGMRIVHVGPGTATVTMDVRPVMINGWGICHGGLVTSLADSAFALACNSFGEVTVAAGFDITFLEPVHQGDTLVANAWMRSRRGRSGLYDVTVTRTSGESPVVVAELRGRSRSTGRPIEPR